MHEQLQASNSQTKVANLYPEWAAENDDEAGTIAQARYAALTLVTSDGIVVFDERATIREISPAILRLFELSAEALPLRPRHWLSYLHSDDRRRVCLLLRQVDGKDTVRQDEVRITMPSLAGPRRWRLRSAPVQTGVRAAKEWVTAITDVTQQLADAEAARHSEPQVRLLSEVVEGVWRADRDGKVVFVSPALQQQPQLSGRCFLGDDWRSLVHEEERDAIWHAWRKSIETGEPFFFQYRIRSVDAEGNERTLHQQTRAVPMRDGDETIREWLGTITDITRAVEAEAERHRSEEAFRSLVTATSDEVWHTDANGVLTQATPGVLRFLGFDPITTSPAVLRALRLQERVHPDDRDTWLRIRKNAVKQGAAYQHTARVHRAGDPAGVYRWLRSHGVPLKNPDGSVRAWIGTFTDITDEKETERRIQESEERSRRLLEAFTDGIFRADAEGNVTEISPRFAQLLDLSPEAPDLDAFKWLWRSKIHPGDRERAVTEWQKSVRESCMHDSRYRVVIQDQQKIMRLQAAAVTNPDGSTREWVGAISDVTAGEEAAEALRNSEERFRSLVQATAGGVWQTDAAGRFTSLSEHYLKIIGITPDAIERQQEQTGENRDDALARLLASHTLRDCVYHEDLPEWESRLHACAVSGTPCEQMLRMHWAGEDSDSLHFVRLLAVPLRAADGAVRAWIGTLSDVTAAVTAQREREQSERQLREAQRLTKSGSWTYDIATDSLHWSDQMFAIWEQNRTDGPLSMPQMLAHFVDSDIERLERLLRWAMQHGTMFAQDFAARTVRGNPRWFQLIVQAQRDAKGGIAGLFGTVLDITERKELEEESRRAQQFARRVALAVPDALYVYNTEEQRTVYANREIGTLLGYEPEDIRSLTRQDAAAIFGSRAGIPPTWQPGMRLRPDSALDLGSGDATHSGSATALASAESGARGVEALVHPADVAKLTLLQEQLLRARDGQVIETTFRHRHRDGTWHWLHAREMVFSRDALGKPREVMGLVQDVTERKVAQDNLRESEEKYRSLVGLLSDWVWETDRDNVYTYVSPQVTTCLGFLPKEMTGLTPFDFMHDQDRERTRLISNGITRSHASFTSLTMRYVSLSGTVVHLEVSGVPMYDAQGDWIGYRGVSRDVTRRREAEDALRMREERLSRLIDSSPDSIATLNLDGQLVSINDGGLRLLGVLDPSEVEGRDWFALIGARTRDGQKCRLELIEPSHQDNFQPDAALETVLRNRTVRFLCCKQAGEGGTQWWDVILAPLLGLNGKPEQVLCIARDITSQKALEAQKDQLLAEAVARAERDPLTGVYDHRAFHARLVEEGSRAQRDGRSLAVAMVDVDNFKFFNDAFGHLEGDAVLRHVASALSESVRAYDIIGRLGGDEFAILMPGVGRMEAYHLLAERIQANALSGQWKPAEYDAPIPLRMSFGVAVFPEEAQSPLQTLHLADERLYRSKRDGHDGILESLRQELGETLAGFPMLDSLVTAVDGKDRYTRRHSEDVLVYAVMIAQNMQLSQEELMTLRVAALLHDVGKIGVSSRILRLPTKLTDEEYEAIKQHAALGAGLIDSLLRNNKTQAENPVDLNVLVAAVRHHHESWDGRGYPDGLAGEAIPFLARLLAVADSYSALTTDRPYRKGLSQEGALKVLRDGAGRQWDARCVEAFIEAQMPMG